MSTINFLVLSNYTAFCAANQWRRLLDCSRAEWPIYFDPICDCIIDLVRCVSADGVFLTTFMYIYLLYIHFFIINACLF